MARMHKVIRKMLTWEIDKGVIKSLHVKGENIIFPWGVETADSSGFYSLEHNVGYRNERILCDSLVSNNSSYIYENVLMPEGHWNLKLKDLLHESSITREATLTSVEDSVLMDFVMRFRFKKRFFDTASIAGKTISHTASDIYHLYPVDKATLNGKEMSIHIEIENSSCAGIMTPNIYVRDHADEWVIHVRMMPNIFCKEVIKICNGWAGTRALPQCISRNLLKIPRFKSYIWYRNERKPYPKIIRRIFNINAFPMAKLGKGRSLHWSVKMSVV